ncbi:MAG TPA: 3-deoxy-manno-octulosonate cytidylyltransferase [Arenimonas sp.]|nr:3-deoxy-manno-octulosonate cytidylyltransferase [Arenimonas sp.]
MSERLDFVVAIPARLAATRLPGKPLRLIGDRPMIMHVVERALAAGAREVVVATDDAQVAAAVTADRVQVCMTRTDHRSGTDRLAECAAQLGWPDDRIIVNLQGDEPFAPPEGIRAVAELLQRSGSEMATLVEPVTELEPVFDPNAVKVVCDAHGQALYFSRAPIPWDRDRFARERLGKAEGWLRHIGIYAYRAGFLRRFAAMPPGRLEQLESLEQLRVLEAGCRIAVMPTPAPFPPGVDTEPDLERAQHIFASLVNKRS